MIDPTRDPYESAEVDRARAVLEAPPDHIGRYRILERLGHGGMGEVYVAEQTEPIKRRVALKVIKAGMDTRQVVARFEAERQALAMMDHPNIARVFDAGTTDTGRPYFVMELVRGVPITQFCDDARLSTRQRIELLVPVCQAVQHAHQKGIIHRDIKPSNVLVTLHDGKPVPKVIDFGIAKATGPSLTDKTVYTEFRQMIGTPAYMSPEQAEMSGLDIDTRSDIYSLGVLTYELLTGTTPFDTTRLVKAGLAEIQRIIKQEDPPRPSLRISTLGDRLPTMATQRSTDPGRISKLVAGELDWIVMKALEKDRRRRYETANDLAADLNRHLAGEPIEAAPPSAVYRVRKFVSKHRATVTAVAAVSALLLLGLAGTSWQWRQAHRNAAIATANESRAERERAEAESQKSRATAAKDAAETEAYIANLAYAQFAMSSGRLADARTRILACPESKRGWEWKFLNSEIEATHFALVIPRTFVRECVLSPDGKRLAISSFFSDMLLIDTTTGKPVCAPLRFPAAEVVFSPDSMRLTGCTERTYLDGSHANRDQPTRIQSWDTTTGSPIGEELVSDSMYDGSSLALFGTRVVRRDHDMLQLREVKRGFPLVKTLSASRSGFEVRGDKIFVDTNEGIQAYDAKTGEQLKEAQWATVEEDQSWTLGIPDHFTRDVGLQLSKKLELEQVRWRQSVNDRQQCDALINAINEIRLRSKAEIHRIDVLNGIDNVMLGVGPAGGSEKPGYQKVDQIVAVRPGMLPRKYFPENSRPLLETVLALSTGNKSSPPAEKTRQPGSITLSPAIPADINAKIFAISPDGSRLVSSGDDNLVHFWDAHTWREIVAIPTSIQVNELKFTPDGTRLILENSFKYAEVWDSRDYSERRKEHDAHSAEIPFANDYVQRLWVSNKPTRMLSDVVRLDASLSTLRKLVILEQLGFALEKLKADVGVECDRITQEAPSRAEALRLTKQSISDARLRNQVLYKLDTDWSPSRGAGSLYRGPGADKSYYQYAAAEAKSWAEGAGHKVEGLIWLAAAHYRLGEPSEALAVLNSLKPTDVTYPDDLKIVFALKAMVHHVLGSHEAAMAALQDARKIASNYDSTSGSRLTAEAAALIDPAGTQPSAAPLGDDKSSTLQEIYYSFVLKHLTRDRVRAAIDRQPDASVREELRKLADNDDWTYQTTHAIFDIFRTEDQPPDRYQLAMEAAEELLRAGPTTVQSRSAPSTIYNAIGDAYYGVGRFEEALEYFNKAVEVNIGETKVNDNNGFTYAMLARTYFKLNRIAEARDALNKAISEARDKNNQTLAIVITRSRALIDPASTQPSTTQPSSN